ncbi:MAG: FKBP-type peptidyl-prolyl cis-trans isomerase [Candidatus Endonucleobacter bathymodioli]|uniref:Peptidyl-prolyl cis-trans isomerase n=1 Tax=Candidatus Endonucleibacter bathymodioli TaxID=539814 RepID=A0AA90NWK9_9GAMM|nr:FKBP-type peptidyl-prolyl cis-trans isomerase [Candidatus Endonucleobacter bathymodioli]
MKMKTVIAITIALYPLQAITDSQHKTELETKEAKRSYSIGYIMAKNIKEQTKNLDAELVSQGLNDAFHNKDPKIDPQKMMSFISEAMDERPSKAEDMSKPKLGEATANLTKGQDFLRENSKKPGVITLASGVQYKVIRNGKGPKPSPTDEVTVNYEGRLINQQVFDSSYTRGEPTSFKVNQVIAGWQECLQLMSSGAEWELYIPADLAYGERGAPRGSIGPNETLIFKVELLSITT